MYLVLKNVILPIQLNDNFIAPDWGGVLEYYPNWSRHSDVDWPIQTYLCAIMTEIDKVKLNGYTGEKAVGELISYIGLRGFANLLNLSLH